MRSPLYYYKSRKDAQRTYVSKKYISFRDHSNGPTGNQENLVLETRLIVRTSVARKIRTNDGNARRMCLYIDAV